MNKQFQKRDILLNLLPREYLPEPEFKAFPIFAIIFIAGLCALLYIRWDQDNKALANEIAMNQKVTEDNSEKIVQVIPVPTIQANSRYILSYLYTLPGLINLGPDWLNVYIALEDNLPTGLWIENMAFAGGNDKGVWPGIKINGISSAPQAVEKVLNLAEDLENSSQFINVNLRGWQWINLPDGGPAVMFSIDMGIER
jgi:hypothetical protein